MSHTTTHKPASVRALIDGVRLAKQNPAARFAVPGGFPISSAEVLAMWQRGVMAKSSRGLPTLTPEQQRRFDDLEHDSRRVNEFARGMRSTGCRNLLRHPAMRARFPHINSQPREF